MGKVTGFMETGRLTPQRRDKNHRITDWQEVYLKWDDSDARKQAGRCMDCGVPFCNSGCPLGNLIPEFNDLIYQGNWKEAIQSLPLRDLTELYSLQSGVGKIERQITSRNSPVEFAQHHARHLALCRLIPSPSR